MKAPDTSTWAPVWQRWWAALLTTPGSVVLERIAELWPLRRDAGARACLRVWVAVHRAQEGSK